MVKCGIAGWVDRSLIASRLFYPRGVSSSEQRLNYYSTRFPLVEVDSSYYGMPARRNSDLWVARTPAGFTFDVKSFSLFTLHGASPKALPPDIRAELPAALRERSSVYLERLPPDVVDAAWDAFRDALEPLQAAGKLGAVFFQFPPWFLPTTKSLAHIEECQERMHGFPIAVEFRRGAWLDERHGAGTMAFLRARDIPYVTVDTPQGFESSLPPVAEATSSRLAVVRFHGRNRDNWNISGAPPSVRFQHNYRDAELLEWVPRIEALAQQAQEVHAIMNNNYSNWAAANAKRLGELLAEAHARGPAGRYSDSGKRQ
ncbi:MAG TPA: DUF72 domain-containing protein [Candidatus Dormibacteraeota bacterium]|nr:DUF72 domain-containing protein [Candidatus Dormibacteraeota bacterium]